MNKKRWIFISIALLGSIILVTLIRLHISSATFKQTEPDVVAKEEQNFCLVTSEVTISEEEFIRKVSQFDNSITNHSFSENAEAFWNIAEKYQLHPYLLPSMVKEATSGIPNIAHNLFRFYEEAGMVLYEKDEESIEAMAKYIASANCKTLEEFGHLYYDDINEKLADNWIETMYFYIEQLEKY